MSCLRCRHRSLNRFKIPHFSKKNYIWSLTKRGPQPTDIALRIRADFSLGHYAFFMAVQIFNGILQSDHMGISRFINFINDTGQGCAFSASGRPCHQYQPLCHFCYIYNCLGQMKLLWIRQFKIHYPNNRSQRIALSKYIGPETGYSRYCEGKIIISAGRYPLHAAFPCRVIQLSNQPVHFLLKNFFFSFMYNGSAQLKAVSHAGY